MAPSNLIEKVEPTGRVWRDRVRIVYWDRLLRSMSAGAGLRKSALSLFGVGDHVRAQARSARPSAPYCAEN